MARLAENVGNHVAASLEMAVGRAMAPLTQSLDTFIKCATREQVDGVRRIVGQFVQQMNTSLSSQMTALGDTMNVVNQGQLQTQQNLQSTLDAARGMAKDAQAIREASTEIAKQMQAFAQEMLKERDSRSSLLDTAQSATHTLTDRLDALSESLRRMQVAADMLTAEMDTLPEEPREQTDAAAEL